MLSHTKTKRNATRNKRYKTILKHARDNFKRNANMTTLTLLQKATQKAASRKVIHSNKASRIISRAMLKTKNTISLSSA
jgi:ribosomal protein S20